MNQKDVWSGWDPGEGGGGRLCETCEGWYCISGMSLCSNLQYTLHRKIAFVIRALPLPNSSGKRKG